MADILRVPVSDLLFQSYNYRMYASGGVDTAFIELPHNYIIGGYEYSKTLLASVRNGYFGLMSDCTGNTDTSTEAFLLGQAQNKNPGIMHASMLGYYGGLGMIMSEQGMTGQGFIKPYTVAYGTLERKASPRSYIRDNKDPNIVYLVLQGPENMTHFGMSKLDTAQRQMLWRHAYRAQIPWSQFLGASNTALPSNSAHLSAFIGFIGHGVEYLYQTDQAVVLMCPGPVTTFYGTLPPSIYVYSISKANGTISQKTYFNLYTLGLLPSGSLTDIAYRFLGFVDASTALLDIQQHAIYRTTSDMQQHLKPTESKLVRALVSYNIDSDNVEVIWSNSQFATPLQVNKTLYQQSGSNQLKSTQPGMYKLTGSLIVPELENSLFIPQSVFAGQWFAAEIITQLHLDSTKTSVTSSKQLPVYGLWGSKQTIEPLRPRYYVIREMTNAENAQSNFDLLCPSSIIGNTTSLPVVGYTASNSSLYTAEFFGEGCPASAYVSTEVMSLGQLPGQKLLHVSYDNVKTTRKDQVLRLHEIRTEGKARKTILPAGEDIIASGCVVGDYFGSSRISNQAIIYNTHIGCAYPWGVVVSMSGFKAFYYGSNTASYASHMHNCFGTAWHQQGYPSTFSGNGTYSPEIGITSSVHWQGKLPDCTITLRRSDTNLKHCGIYLNNKAFPIKAVSYSLNPNPYIPTGAPTSWVVEAHDVATGEWIEVDKQEDISLVFPITYGYINSNTFESCASSSDGKFFGDARQYRNYFLLNDIDSKCPQGAHAFRITFKKSRCGTIVCIGSFMVQEKPWDWIPVTPGCFPSVPTTANKNATGSYALVGMVLSHSSGTSTALGHSSYTFRSLHSGYVPLGMSIIGPRVYSRFPSTQPEYSNSYLAHGAIYYNTSRFMTSPRPFFAYNFGSDKLEIQGIQFTLYGWYGSNQNESCAMPSKLRFDWSDDGNNWTPITTIDDPEMMPGQTLADGELNKYFSAKTFLFELEEPIKHQFYRVAWGDDSQNLNSSGGNAQNYWPILNFSFFKKKPADIPKDALQMQSVIGSQFCGNQTYKYIDTNPNYWYGSWCPWATDFSSGKCPQGCSAGFDNYVNLNAGYHAYAGSTITSVNLTQSGPQSVVATWEGPWTRRFKPGSEYVRSGEAIPMDFAGSLPNLGDASLDKPVYTEKVKIVAYAFVRSATDANVNSHGRPTKWKLYAATKDSDWTVIDERTKDDWSTTDCYNIFKVDKPGWYTKYKMEFIESSTPNSGIYLGSIDTFIEPIKEDSPHVYTIHPRNLVSVAAMVGSNYPDNPISPELVEKIVGTVTTIKGSLIGGNANDLVTKFSRCRAASFTYDEDGTIELIIDQKTDLQTHSIAFRLSPSMEIDELPKRVVVSGSKDKADWTPMGDKNNIGWDKDDPYFARLTLDTPGTFRYIKLVFHKNQLPEDKVFTEHWLLRTHCAYGSITDTSEGSNQGIRQLLYKIMPDKYLVTTGFSFGFPLANLWLTEKSLAQVHGKFISVVEIDPISQAPVTTRTITPTGGRYILGAVLDSGKNIWYWANSYETFSNEPTDKVAGSAILAVHSSFSNTLVRVKFEKSVVDYAGSPLTLKVLAWIEDPSKVGENKKVAGKIKLVLSGGDAKFVANTSDTITVTTEDGQVSEQEFTAKGPDRVSVNAFLTR